MPRKHTNPKHERYTPKPSCINKRAFRSEDQALKAAELQMLTDMQLELSVYNCHHCLQWHLTRQNHNR